MPWTQTYDPLGSPLLSTLAAALPLVGLLGLLATHRVRAHVAALVALGAALAVAVFVVGMPGGLAARAALLGAAYGLFPIGWIVLNVIFLYQLAEGRGGFVVLRRLVTGVTDDRRLQLLLIAFGFGAFFEGAAGFGTPVAVTAALLIGLGFQPLEASALSLIANTAPVAFGALGTPIIALQGVTGLDLGHLSAMIGRQLPVFSLIVPFWFVAIAMTMLLLVVLRSESRARRRRWRARHGCCVQCGYDLRASSERCPECGVAIPAGATSVG